MESSTNMCSIQAASKHLLTWPAVFQNIVVRADARPFQHVRDVLLQQWAKAVFGNVVEQGQKIYPVLFQQITVRVDERFHVLVVGCKLNVFCYGPKCLVMFENT